MDELPAVPPDSKLPPEPGWATPEPRVTTPAPESRPDPTWRRRGLAALAGLGVYILVELTAVWLPSALSDYAFVIGLAAGTLVAGGLTPALTVRQWLSAGLLTFGLVVVFALVVISGYLLTWSPDRV
jgi:hypothetical protein